MKSKTSLFNRTIILNMLRRYWVMFAAYFAVMGGTILITLVNALQEADHWTPPAGVPHYGSFFEFLQYIPNETIIISFIAAPIVAAMLFSYLYNPRHTGLMASLPVSRESMFMSVSAAGMAGITVCNLVILTLALVLEIAYGDVSLPALGIVLLMMTLSMLVFYGIAVFCCMLTGNIFAGPAVYLVFNFLTIGAESLINNLLRDVVFGLGNGYNYKTMFLCPVLQLGNTLNFDTDYVYDEAGNVLSYTWAMEGLGVLAVYALVSLAFLALGLLLYKNRRMETAGDTIAIEALKPVFRLCMAVGSGLLFANFMKETLYHVTPTETMAAVYAAVLLCIGGVLGYFIAQMLITKSVNVFRSGWKSVGVYVLCVVALVTAIECDLFGYERRVPDAEDVESVYVTTFDGYNAITFEETENIRTAVQLHSNIITNKAFHEIEIGSVAAALPEDTDLGAEFRKQSIQFSYTLKNGDTLVRRYSVSYDPDAIRSDTSEIRVLEALLNTDEAIAARCVPPFPVTAKNVSFCSIEWVDAETYERFDFSDLAPSQIAALYNECILPDIADGRLGVYNIIENKDYALSKYRCNIYIDMYEEELSSDNAGTTYRNYFNLVLYVTTDASRTLEYLAGLGIKPATVYDAAVNDGYDYSDLGRYRVNGDSVVPEYNYDYPTTAAYEPIGGADGPTAVFVTR